MVLTLLIALVSCQGGDIDESRRFAAPIETVRQHPTVIHQPSAVGILDTPIVADNGRDIPAGTACETCHGPVPDPELFAPSPAGEPYHTKIELEHGPLSCDHCHDQDRTQLHLADGEQLPFSQVMRLCAQCHGPMYRDYEHGAHGGMNGYWDTRQGGRVRNNCVDCHASHGPAYPVVSPVFPPRDRFFERTAKERTVMESTVTEGGQ